MAELTAELQTAVRQPAVLEAELLTVELEAELYAAMLTAELLTALPTAAARACPAPSRTQQSPRRPRLRRPLRGRVVAGRCRY